MVPMKLMIANSRNIYLCKSNWKEGGNIHMYMDMDIMIPKISFFIENKKRNM